MKRVLLTLAYDGTNYHGWQVQQKGITVQECVQNALLRLLGTRPALTGCSRTDAGVHARQFCCHLDCDDSLPDAAFLRGLNSILPDDVAVVACREVPSGFHARYSASGKNYVYRFYESRTTDPFLSRYALRVEKRLDIDAMNEFCTSIIGEHDFLPFSSAGRTVESTVRRVSECRMTEDGGLPALTVTANGFLYNMVRIITGTALAVSRGQLSPDCAKEIFESGERSMAGDTAPACGLFLNKVFYKDF